MKVFLTGSTGYIGNQLALALAKNNFRVNALVRNPKSNRVPKHKNIKIFKGDICELNSIRKAIKNCDYVCHTAAFTDLKYEHVDKFYETNVIGTKNVLEAAFESGVEKFLYTSTLSVFGPALYHVPITEHQPKLNSINNDYELTKTMSEELVLMYANKGLPCCILNVSRVYGPGLNTYSNGVNKIIQKIMNDKILVVPSNLDVEANYVYIDDVINGQITALRSGISGEHYIIGGENADYNKLFGLAKDVSNSKIKIIKINYKLIRNLIKFQANINLLFGLKSLVTPKVLDSLFTHRSASSKKAISTLNYKITPLQIGIEKTIKFLKIQAS
jgi:nucleoside-diphosphate-sugar epimerase